MKYKVAEANLKLSLLWNRIEQMAQNLKIIILPNRPKNQVILTEFSAECKLWQRIDIKT